MVYVKERSNKLATIRDVAAAAGVSATAVSRYLSQQVSLPPMTAKRINDAVAMFGYEPNVLASRLSRGKTETIGVVTPDIAYPFFGAIASAAGEEAFKYGYDVVICNTHNQIERELLYLKKLAARHVDGLIFLTNHPDDGALRERLASVKNLVLLDEDVTGSNAAKVFMDNEHGGFLATHHLIENGHRTIAHVTGPKGLQSVNEKLIGYRSAISEAGLPLRENMILFDSFEEEFGTHAFQILWARSERPTAIFASSDALAIGILGAARRAGVVIPKDLSIVGFDDLPYVSYLDPPLTTIRQLPDALGRRGIELLIRGFRGEPVSSEPERLPVELIVRGSVARRA